MFYPFVVIPNQPECGVQIGFGMISAATAISSLCGLYGSAQYVVRAVGHSGSFIGPAGHGTGANDAGLNEPRASDRHHMMSLICL